MRTISLREPYARALILDGAAVVGRGWPSQGTEATILGQRGPVGIQVSTQGGESWMRFCSSTLLGGGVTLSGENLPGLNLPKGHVVASANVITLVDGNFRSRDVETDVIAALSSVGTPVARPWVNAWMKTVTHNMIRWWWVIAQPKRCTPVKWRGVMSQFPVPDEVFSK